MSKSVLGLAVLGAVLVFVFAQMLVPDTPLGHSLTFAAYWAALYPVARHVWFFHRARWRYWVGLIVGGVVVWMIEAWRISSQVSAETDHVIGLAIFALASLGLAAAGWRAMRQRH